MLDIKQLSKRFTLNSPASKEAIALERAKIKIPQAYIEFLNLSNGLNTDGNLSLLEVEDLSSRNNDYELGEYLPDYIMIGDDGGGNAILMDMAGQIFENDMGSLDMVSMRFSCKSIEELLLTYDGKTLLER
ncbi:MAG: SMI1/KNR4 family protein [Pelistega sp.]|nr:SMI1/KNR4 family protein [Pelistega sp.]